MTMVSLQKVYFLSSFPSSLHEGGNLNQAWDGELVANVMHNEKKELGIHTEIHHWTSWQEWKNQYIPRLIDGTSGLKVCLALCVYDHILVLQDK